MQPHTASPAGETKFEGQPTVPESLALLYQGLLTGIVRMRAQRQQIPNGESFRHRTKAVLQEVERVAVDGGYDLRDVRDTHFAVIAFLDSVILNSTDPARAEWERRTLQQELFGQTDAGEVFFERLEQFRSRRDSEQLSDILEVYLLCLLLGFEGRYSGRRRGELDGLVESLRMRIDYIRGPIQQLSPFGVPVVTPAPREVSGEQGQLLLIVTLGVVIFTVFCFLLLKWNLHMLGEQLRGSLLDPAR